MKADINPCHKKKKLFLIVMVSAPFMEHDMPIPMVIISLYPKHIQVGEERMQVREMILLNRISYKLLSA